MVFDKVNNERTSALDIHMTQADRLFGSVYLVSPKVGFSIVVAHGYYWLVDKLTIIMHYFCRHGK
jgi:hypothetical protein